MKHGRSTPHQSQGASGSSGSESARSPMSETTQIAWWRYRMAKEFEALRRPPLPAGGSPVDFAAGARSPARPASGFCSLVPIAGMPSSAEHYDRCDPQTHVILEPGRGGRGRRRDAGPEAVPAGPIPTAANAFEVRDYAGNMLLLHGRTLASTARCGASTQGSGFGASGSSGGGAPGAARSAAAPVGGAAASPRRKDQGKSNRYVFDHQGGLLHCVDFGPGSRPPPAPYSVAPWSSR
mmetsp:Transcript_77502/g.250869  ORF Transcript_77502/g.250869 Transcript_77502/m.250869 type:complete len:237 (-) Transcript_77502:214-924(-)